MTNPNGQALQDQDRDRTGSLQLCARLGLAITPPTSEAEYETLAAFALSVPPEPKRTTFDQLSKHLEFMAAVLPSRGVDEETGRKRTSVYASILRDYTNEALAFMAREACKTLDWFPTPKQCLEILARYTPPDDGRDRARRLCNEYQHDKFETWIANVKAGSPLGDVPDQWLRIAVERGSARRLDDGRYVSRALYAGPSMPVPSVNSGRFAKAVAAIEVDAS